MESADESSLSPENRFVGRVLFEWRAESESQRSSECSLASFGGVAAAIISQRPFTMKFHEG